MNAASAPEAVDPTATPLPPLTIAICTHNRSRDLRGCLEALLRQNLSGVKILVIDSASRVEERREIVAATRAHNKIDLIRLDRPGIAIARNTAVVAATTDWIAFIDDDIVAASDWLDQARRLITTAPDACAVIGGRLDPIYPEGADAVPGPRWRQLLSLIQLEGEGDQTDHAQIVSGNALFRRDALLAVGSFPPQLGRVGDTLLSGEEKLAVERLRDRGARILYSDRLRVGHKIPQERLRRNWAARRAYWDGVTDQKIRRLRRDPLKPMKLAKIAASIPVLALAYPSRSSEQEFFLRFWYNFGFIRELLFSIPLQQGATDARDITGAARDGLA